MSVFIVICVIVLVAAVTISKTRQGASESTLLDYRCNGDYRWDSVEGYDKHGRTDRFAHHVEGDAYKVDEHKHF